MRTVSSRLARSALVALVGFVCAEACGSSNADSPTTAAMGNGGATGSGGTKVIMPDGATPMAEAGSGGISALCGVALHGCDPDAARSCAAFAPPSSKLELFSGGAPGASGAGAFSGGAGESFGGAGGAGGVTWGAGGSSHRGGDSGGGAAGTSGAAGAGREAGGSAGAPVGVPDYACRVVRSATGPLASCGASGRGLIDSPCFTGSDCGPGLACAQYRGVARCRPYCCHGEESCATGSYCSELPLVDDSIPASVSSMLVPVCAPADDCDLLKPPCADGESCQCPAGKACLVVRPDGTTTCETPGTGAVGDACPCQYGHICSLATGKGVCQKLCPTLDVTVDGGPSCGTGRRCQASAELPSGWGICVGG